MPKRSRRTLLKIGAAVLGVGILVCAVLALFGKNAALTLPEFHMGKDAMKARILIAYATRGGSTAEVAQAMGEVLVQQGYAVDVKPMLTVESLDGYQAVVLGSAVRMGSWLGEARDFAKDNKDKLAALPVAIFSVHMLNWEDTPDKTALREAYTAKVKEYLTPRVEAFFTGKMDLAKLSFLDRMIAKAVKAVDEDKRDWTLIRSWAAELGPKLGV